MSYYLLCFNIIKFKSLLICSPIDILHLTAFFRCIIFHIIETFWESIDIFEIEEVRNCLRDLVKYLEKNVGQTIYYTHFKDSITSEERNGFIFNENKLKNYKKSVEHYLNQHKNNLAIFKLKKFIIMKKNLKTLK